MKFGVLRTIFYMCTVVRITKRQKKKKKTYLSSLTESRDSIRFFECELLLFMLFDFDIFFFLQQTDPSVVTTRFSETQKKFREIRCSTHCNYPYARRIVFDFRVALNLILRVLPVYNVHTYRAHHQ